MPKQTFYNLPESKARQILQAAFDEFTLNSYREASITRLVNTLQIAKGSVYQYFENKKDLYHYLIYIARNRKLEYLQDATDKDDLGFWELIENMFEANILFDLENPVQSRFLYTVSMERFSDEIGNMRRDQISGNINTIKYLLEKEKDRGKLRNDLSTELMGFLITQLIAGLPDYLEYQFGKKDINIKAEKGSLYSLTSEERQQTVKEMVRLLRGALRKSKKK